MSDWGVTRRRIGAIMALLLAWGAFDGVPAQAKRVRTIERIVGIVNNEIILLSEVNDRVRPLRPQLARIPDKAMRAQKLAELRRGALDHMIDEKLINQQAVKLKLRVTDQELDRAIADVMRKNHLSKEQLEEALRREGKSLRAYRQQLLRPQLLRMKVLNVTVRSRVSVSSDEVRASYQKNLRTLGVETKVRARHIFIAIGDGATPQTIKAKRKLATELLAKIKAGADFAALAKTYSQDSVTRTDGGDLGYFGRGTLPGSIEDVVLVMKKGEVRGPLRSVRGFHLIQVTDRKESSARPFKDVRRQLRRQIYAEKLEKSTKAWLREVRKKAHIVSRL